MANITLGPGRQDFVFERNGESNTITDFRSAYFTATLTEAQEAPPNADIPGIDGTGRGVLNFAHSRFAFTLYINGINLLGGPGLDDMTDMHIHDGPPGVAGPIIFPFRNDAETAIDAANGAVTGGWDNVEATAPGMTAANVADLLAGGTYFNIHTNRDMAGFIRGQILPQGTGLDRIDLSEMNIGSFATLQQIVGQAAGNAVIRTFLDGEDSTLRLEGVRRAGLDPSHFEFAGSSEDTMNGTADADDLFGAGANDVLNGLAGNDRVFGEDNSDALFGGVGLDMLTGGGGLDVMVGAAGGDRFIFTGLGNSGNRATGVDRITDFTSAQDHIVLTAIDANTQAVGNQAFTFIGGASFSAAGQVRITEFAGGNTFVWLNTTGNDGVEMVFKLDGDVPLAQTDFLL